MAPLRRIDGVYQRATAAVIDTWKNHPLRFFIIGFIIVLGLGTLAYYRPTQAQIEPMGVGQPAGKLSQLVSSNGSKAKITHPGPAPSGVKRDIEGAVHQPKNFYKGSEKPTLEVETVSPAGLFGLAKTSRSITAVQLIDPSTKKAAIDPDVTTSQQGSSLTSELVIDQTILHRPGKYTAVVTIVQDGYAQDISQDFTWGVLDVNVRRSYNHPNTAIQIGMSVLDDLGHTLCQATVALDVTDPQGRVQRFATADQSVRIDPNCVDRGVTNNPDYAATYLTGGAGQYVMTVTATTSNGTRAISDAFQVDDSQPFDVERTSFPTRIYPHPTYPVSFTITAKQDYRGPVVETVPASFDLSGLSDGAISTTPDPAHKLITWQVDWRAGQTATLGYTIAFPNRAPDFYVLGPLKIGAFQEARQWQIASDASACTLSYAAAKSWTTAGWATCNSSYPGATVSGDTASVSTTVAATLTLNTNITTNALGSFAITGTSTATTVTLATNTLTVNGAVTIAQPTAAVTNSITITSGTLTIQNANNLAFPGTTTTASTIATLTVTNGTVDVGGSITYTSTASMPAANNVVSVTNSGTIRIRGAETEPCGTLQNITTAGTLQFDSTFSFGTTTATCTAVFSTIGSTIVKLGGNFSTNTSGPSPTFNASSTATITASLTVTPTVAITFGSLTINASAVLTLAGNITVAGTFTNNSGTSALTGSFTTTFSGVSNIASASFATTFNSLTIAASAVVTANMNFTVTNALTFSATAAAQSLTLASGSVVATLNSVSMAQPSAAFTSAFNVNAGTASLSGSFAFPGTTTTTSFISTAVVTTGLLDVGGSITYTSTSSFPAANSVASLNSSGTIRIRGAETQQCGTLRNQTTAGTIQFDSSFTFGVNTATCTAIFSTIASSTVKFGGTFTTTASGPAPSFNATSTEEFTATGTQTAAQGVNTYGNVLIDSGAVVTLATNGPTVAGTFTNNNTTGSWTGALTTTFSGVSKAITGNTTFSALTLAAAAQTQIAASTTVTVTNALTATQAAGITQLTLNAATSTLSVGSASLADSSSTTAVTWSIGPGTFTSTAAITLTDTSATATHKGILSLTTGIINANGGLNTTGTSPGTAAINNIDISADAGTFNLKGQIQTNTVNGASGWTFANTTCTNGGGTFVYADSVAQTVYMPGASGYCNLQINNTNAAGATLNASITTGNVNGNLTVGDNSSTAAIFNDATGLAIAGGAFTFGVKNAATFNMPGTATYPTGFSTFTFGASSTVNYQQTATPITITNATYGNLGLVPAGTATQNLPAAALVVAGNLTIGDNSHTATVVANGANGLTVGGNWLVAATGSSVFTNSSSTVTFNSTATGQTIDNRASSFFNVIFNGSGGTWKPATNNLTIAGDLTMTSGTLQGNSALTVTVNGNIACGAACGAIDMTANSGTATFTQSFSAGKAFGTSVTADTTGWTFYNLTFTSASGTQTATTSTTPTSPGSVTVTHTLTISANTVLNAGTNSRDWILTSTGTPLTNSGTLTGNASEFVYTGTTTATTITAVANTNYANLSIKPTAATTYTVGSASSQTLNITGDLVIGDGTVSHTPTIDCVGTAFNPAISVDGNLTLNSPSVWTKGTGILKLDNVADTVTLTDNNSSKQDLGPVQIGDSATAKVVNLGSDASLTTLNDTAAATFDLNNHSLTLLGSSGTPFTKTGALGVTGGGTFIYQPTASSTVNVTSATYHNLTFNSSSTTFNLTSGGVTTDTANGGGNLTITAGTLDTVSSSNFPITVGGNWSNSGTFTARNGTVTFNGAAQQTLSGTMTSASAFYDLTVTNASGANASDCELTGFTASVVFATAATASHNLTFTTASSRIQYHDTATYTFANINWNGQATGTKIYFRDSVATAGHTWLLKVTGTQTAVSYLNVSHSDASVAGGTTIDASDGTNTNCGTNTSWNFGQTLTGTVYLSDESTAGTTGNGGPCDSSTAVVSARINGGSARTAVCSSSDGTFSLTLPSNPSSGDRITLYLTSSMKANYVYVSDGTALAGITLYQDEVVVNYQTGSSIVITNLTDYDTTTNATDMLYDAVSGSPNTLTVSAGKRLHVPASRTFAPGGTVTSPKIHLKGTYTGAAETLTLSASGSGTARPFYIDGGTFTPSSDVVVYTGTAASDVETVTYNTLQLAPTSGTQTYTLNATGTLNTTDWSLGNGSTLTVTAATNNPTINIAGNLTINSGVTYTKGSGTTTFKPTGTKTWTDSTSGQDLGPVTIGSGASTPKINLGSSVKAASVNITGSHELNANGAKTLTLTGSGTPLTIGGTFTYSTGTVSYAPASTATILALTGTGGTNGYYNLDVAAGTATLGGVTTVNNNVSISGGTLDTDNSNSYALTVTGSYSNSGTFTARSGTVTFNATSGGKTLAGTLNGSSAFYNLVFNGVSGAWSFSAAVAVGNDFTVTNGAVTASNNNLTVSRDYLLANTAGVSYVAGSSTITVSRDWSDTGTLFGFGTSTVVLNGTGNLNVSQQFYNLSIAYTGQTTTLTAGGLTVIHVLTFNGGIAYTSAPGGFLNIQPAGNVKAIVFASPTTLNGVGGGRNIYIRNSNASATTTIDGGNYGSWGLIALDVSANDTVSPTGDITTTNIVSVAPSGSNNLIFDTANHNITAAAFVFDGGGSSTATFGSSTITTTITGGDGFYVANNGGSHTLNLNSSTVNVPGNVKFSNGTGTVTVNPGSSTLVLQPPAATTATLTSNSQSLYNLTLNGNASGNVQPADATVITDDLTMTASSLIGTQNVTVNGNVLGTAGIINLTGGTFTQRVATSKNFGTSSGSTAWTFNGLTFSNSAAASPVTLTTAAGTGGLTISGDLLVGKSGDNDITTLDAGAGSRTWTLNATDGNPFQLLASPSPQAVLVGNTSTISYNGNAAGNTTIQASSGYFNLNANNPVETFVLGGAVTAAGTVLIRTAITGATLTTSGFNYSLTAGFINIGTSSTFTPNTSTVTLTGTSGTLFKRNSTGTFTAGSSTVIVTSASGTPALLDSSTTFNNLTINAGTAITAGGTSTISNNLAIQAGTFDDAGSQITGNATGALTVSAGATLKTATAFPTTFTSGHITLNATSLVVYSKTTSQTISSTPSAYGHLQLSAASGSPTKTPNGPIVVAGNLTIDASNTYDTASGSNYPLSIAGNYTNNGTFTAQNGAVTLNGTTTQTLSGGLTAASSSAFYDLTITNNSGANPSGNEVTGMTASVNFAAAATVTNNYTLNAAHIRVQYLSGSTYTFTNISWTGLTGAGNSLYFRNSATSGSWLLNVSGTQSVSYVDVSRSDASGGSQIAANNGTNTDSTNNTHWLFISGFTLGGTVYATDESTPISGTPLVRVKVNGAGSYSASAASGVYSIPSVVMSAGDAMTIYLDTNGGVTGATFTVSTGAAMSGIDIYQDRAATRCDNSCSLTNANIDQWDKNNDTDIHAAATTSPYNLTVDNDWKLLIKANTFAPGGTVTTAAGGGNAYSGNVEIKSGTTLNMSGNALGVGGNYTNGGTLTAGSNTTTFTATTTGQTLTGTMTGGSAFNNVVFNGSGGAWSFGATSATVKDLTLTNGTVTAPSTTLTLGGNYTNNATFTHNSGTVLVNGSAAQTLDGTMTSGSAFNNLTLTNTTGTDDPACGTSFTPGVIFNTAATTAATFAITTAHVRVQYHTGSTYAFNNINWDGGSTLTRLQFRNSSLSSGSWTLNVTAVGNAQTKVSNVDVARSNATSGAQIIASDGTNLDCSNNQNWMFDESLTMALNSSSVTFGTIQPGSTPSDQTTTVTTTTNANTGYVVYAWSTQPLTYGSFTISDWTGTNTSPTSFNAGSFGFGYTTDDASLTGGTANRFTSGGAKYAGFAHTGPTASSNEPVADATAPVTADAHVISYRVYPSGTQSAQTYSTVIIYVAAAKFP